MTSFKVHVKVRVNNLFARLFQAAINYLTKCSELSVPLRRDKNFRRFSRFGQLCRVVSLGQRQKVLSEAAVCGVKAASARTERINPQRMHFQNGDRCLLREHSFHTTLHRDVKSPARRNIFADVDT